MFQHPMKEAASCEVVVDQQYTPAAVKAMLRFLYAVLIPSEELQVPALAAQLLSLSVYYQIDDLQQHVENQLVDSLTANNVLQCLHLSQEQQADSLQDRTLQFLSSNCKQLLAARPDLLDSIDGETCRLVMKAFASALVDSGEGAKEE